MPAASPVTDAPSGVAGAARPDAAAVCSDAPPLPGPSRSAHLWQIDMVRLLTFAAVIAVHVLAFTEQPDNRAAAGAMMLLQFGREVFFALTAFVLVHSTFDRPLRTLSFWRRRLLYVAVPYVSWTFIYWAYGVLGPAHAPWSAAALGTDLLYGGAEYHLYFLLVTIQLYLAFPLILSLVRRTARRPVEVLAVVGAANLAWLAVLQYGSAPSGPVGAWLFEHAYELLPTYSVYVLGGCYAAVHLPAIDRYVERHGRRLLLLAAVAGSAALAAYAVQLPFMAPRSASAVLQPATLLSCLAAVAVVYLVGYRWDRGGRRGQRTVEVLSDASFGVYLSHPLVLLVLIDFFDLGNGTQALTPLLATTLAYLLTVAGGVAIAVLARRSPLSLPLAGRPWRSPAARRPLVRPLPAPAPTRAVRSADVPLIRLEPLAAPTPGGDRTW